MAVVGRNKVEQQVATDLVVGQKLVKVVLDDLYREHLVTKALREHRPPTDYLVLGSRSLLAVAFAEKHWALHRFGGRDAGEHGLKPRVGLAGIVMWRRGSHRSIERTNLEHFGGPVEPLDNMLRVFG
ncbi:MAG TPA: hypothetical protein VG271_15870 [Beijerinckiaceae bacterium]|nr:hypothetical protein [Beijerinckiaceae bacterium]